jgi:uncharacterized protein with GYD domain
MNRYVVLMRFTGKGVDAVRQSPERADGFRATAQKIGCKVTSMLWTMGPHDGVVTFEAPNDEAASALVLSGEQHGFVTTCTMRAFDEAEFKNILTKMK